MLTVDEKKGLEQHLLQLHNLKDMPAWKGFVEKVQTEAKTAYNLMVSARDSYEAARQTGQYIAFSGMASWLEMEIAATERILTMSEDRT